MRLFICAVCAKICEYAHSFENESCEYLTWHLQMFTGTGEGSECVYADLERFVNMCPDLKVRLAPLVLK